MPAVIAALTSELGVVPVRVDAPGDSGVSAAKDAWNFEGLLVVQNGAGDYRGWSYVLYATVPSVRGVEVVGPGGLVVGDPIADYTTAFGFPPNPSNEAGTVGYFADGEYSLTNAHVAFLAKGTSTTITVIVAPTGA